MVVFVNLIKQSFQFLADEFGYSISEESFIPDIKMGNGTVVYQSPSVGIEIEVNINEVFLKIGQSKLPRAEWLDFQDVMKYFAPELSDVYLLEGEILKVKDPIVEEIRINNIANLLQQYCKLLIMGDFSMLAKIKELETKRKQAIWDDLQWRSQEFQRKRENK